MPREELNRRTAMQIVAGSLVTASGCATFSSQPAEVTATHSSAAADGDREPHLTPASASPNEDSVPATESVNGGLYFVYYPRDDEPAFQRVTAAIRKHHGAWQRYGGDVDKGISMPSRVLAWVGPEAMPELRAAALRVAPFDARHSPARIDPTRDSPYLCATEGKVRLYTFGTKLTVVLAPNSWRHVPKDVSFHSTQVVAEQLSAMLSDYPIKVLATPAAGWRDEAVILAAANPPGLLKIECRGEVPSHISAILQSHPQVLGTELVHQDFFDACHGCGMG